MAVAVAAAAENLDVKEPWMGAPAAVGRFSDKIPCLDVN
jgi:hypothetical protein